MTPESFVDVLAGHAAHRRARPSCTFLPDGDQDAETLTFGALHDRVRAVAATLQQHTRPGDRVLVLLPPGADFVVAFYACLYAGTVAVPAPMPTSVDPRDRSVERLARIAADCDAAVLLTASAFGPLLEQAGAVWAKEVVAVDAVTGAPDDWREHRPRAVDLAMLQYTSGSTAQPRGVMLSHANLLANLRELLDRTGLGPESEGISWVPPYHDMGLIGMIMQPALAGCHVTVMSPWQFLARPLRWLEVASANRVTHTGAPNFALDLCVRKSTPQQRAALDLSAMQVLMLGGEPVRADSLAGFAEAFAVAGFDPAALMAGYGLAESTVMVATGSRTARPTVTTFDAAALGAGEAVVAAEGRRLVACGPPRDADAVRIVADGAVVADGRLGEIWTSGPSTAAGYWRDPEATAEVFGAELAGRPYLRTGDLGFLHGGELFVAGRIKDLVVVRGVNVHPQDVELTAERAHAALRPGCGAAFGVDDGAGEQLVVVHEVREGAADAPPDAVADAAAVAEAVVAAVRAGHGLTPARVVLIAPRQLPKTTSGKIQRRLARTLLDEGAFTVVAQWRSADAGESAVLDRIAQAARGVLNLPGTAPLDLDTPVTALGVDSLTLAELVSAVETAFGTALPIATMPRDLSIRQLAAYVPDGVGPAPVPAPVPAAPEPVAIPPARSGALRFADLPEFAEVDARLAELTAGGSTNPFFTVQQRRNAAHTSIDGRDHTDYTSYNYLGLSGDPDVSAAAKAAIDAYGTSVGASRLVSGERDLHRDLEAEIARFLGVEDAVVFVSGNLTNVAGLGTLARPGDLVVHDELAHDSLVRGAILSGATRRTFPHNDPRALDALLTAVRDSYERVFVVAEGVYSMDGDVLALPDLLAVKERHGAFLMVDEAHSLGVLGETGRGVAEHFGVHPRRVEIAMGTLSKTLAGCGGYLAGPHRMVEYLRYNAGGFMYSVGLSPADTAAALAALRKLSAEPERVARLRERSELFRAKARAAGLDVGLSGGSAVVPVMTGSSERALRASAALREHGVAVAPILPPAVEEGAARLRFFLTSEHTDAQVDQTITAVAAVLG